MSFSTWYSSYQGEVERAYFDHVCKAAREKTEPHTLSEFAIDLFKIRVHGTWGVEL